ncbi:hypothetical protein LWE61_20165 [Sphingobium sufflavum]|uniref:hypothetical protein n=1 Tax=Sphingobium sufflavum TaxID=1129547 RepID=UPI001F311D3E|nr:hypothetical protein [Sphingobium sufflavum]MCE7798848.1 hypothetical protein [Sphingobium sufflavum]
MSGGEYEPEDSRNVTGAAHTKDGRWSGDKEPPAKTGEYEPADSRNVTGTAKTADGRWTNKGEEVVPGVPDSHPFTAEEAAKSAAKSQSSTSNESK